MQIKELRTYLLLAYAAVGLTVSYSITVNPSLFATLRHLTFEKAPLLVFANAAVATVLVLLQRVLSVTVGTLRDLELEQVIEHGKSTILDTVLFLILASPTVNGGDVPHGVLFGCLGGIICLKLYHHIAQIRVAHLLEAGLMEETVLSRMTLLLCLLFAADVSVNVYCFRFASNSSSFYIWMLFESLGLIMSALRGLSQLAVLFVDSSLEAASEHGQGWPWKNEFVFSLDVLHDVGTLGCFLTFLLLFLFTHPARLPIYLASDVVQTTRQLVQKVQSFRRYKRLATRLESDFPNATLDELEAADTCIICRDLLTIGAKRLICGHVLHFECLKGWFVHHQSCPTCRMEIPITPPTSKESKTRRRTDAESQCDRATGNGPLGALHRDCEVARYADETEVSPAVVLEGTAHVDENSLHTCDLLETKRLLKRAAEELAELSRALRH